MIMKYYINMCFTLIELHARASRDRDAELRREMKGLKDQQTEIISMLNKVTKLAEVTTIALALRNDH